MESALTTSPSRASATARASADLPAAVGPTNATSGWTTPEDTSTPGPLAVGPGRDEIPHAEGRHIGQDGAMVRRARQQPAGVAPRLETVHLEPRLRLEADQSPGIARGKSGSRRGVERLTARVVRPRRLGGARR